MDTKALRLASRFALPPNSLGYCGKDSAPEKFKKCIIDEDCSGVVEEIEKFIVLNPYLEMLSVVLGKDKFSFQVIQAYWLGNDELKKVKNKDYFLLLEKMQDQGVPSWLIAELKEKPPKKFIPTHLFQVLHVGVGRASGSVPYNIDTINNCMIRWGKVEKIGKKELTANLHSLKKVNGKYKLTYKKGTFPFRHDFTPGLKVGEIVSVHWKQVVKILTEDEVEKLEFWTKQVLANLQN